MDTANEYGNLAIQQYMLPMMLDLDRFCREHDIRYSISDGTLLGSVRHKGFIPWDDDIDISMDRENFNKFMAAFEKDGPAEYEVIHDIWIRRFTRKDNPNKSAFPPEGCIDIFLFDNEPGDPKRAKKKLLLLTILQGMIKKHVVYEGFSPIQIIQLFGTHVLGKLVPMKTKLRWYDEVSQWGNEQPTARIARYNGSNWGIHHTRYSSGMIAGYTELSFEGQSLMAVEGWDEFLRALYHDDYMTPPAKNARSTNHTHV